MYIKISHLGNVDLHIPSIFLFFKLIFFSTSFRATDNSQEKNQDNFHLGKFCDDKQMTSFNIHGSEWPLTISKPKNYHQRPQSCH